MIAEVWERGPERESSGRREVVTRKFKPKPYGRINTKGLMVLERLGGLQEWKTAALQRGERRHSFRRVEIQKVWSDYKSPVVKIYGNQHRLDSPNRT